MRGPSAADRNLAAASAASVNCRLSRSAAVCPVAGAGRRARIRVGDAVDLHALGKRSRQHRIGLGVEVHEPRNRGVAQGNAVDFRNPGQDRCPAAHDERHDRAEGKAARVGTPGVGQAGKRTIEPAVLDPADARQAAFEQVLPVEVRARAIGRVHGMNDERLTVPKQAVQLWHCTVERKEAVERQTRALAGCGQRDAAPEARVVRIAHGGDGGQPIQTAAQHHNQQARIARAGDSHLGHEAPQGQAGGPVPQQAPTAHDVRFATAHAISSGSLAT